MKTMLRAADNQVKSGRLLQGERPKRPSQSQTFRLAPFAFRLAQARPGSHRLAFAGVYLFTLLLYMRPNDLFPELLGTFPLVKIVAIATPLVYVASKLGTGQRLITWPLEMKMVVVITALCVVFMPIAVSAQDSQNLFLDVFLKVVIIFVLLVNLLDTRERLCALFKLVVICGVALALGAIKRYLAGEFTMVSTLAGESLEKGIRIEGIVSGMFGNPNDLATALNLLLPLAVILALLHRGMARLLYFGGAVVLAMGVIVTFSRGGFLGLMAAAGVMLWKFGRRNRMVTVVAALLAVMVLALSLPGGYGARLSTILHIEQDQTGSAQERAELLERAAQVAARHPVVGVGMGNFHIYSVNEKEAHNSYLEIAAELGAMGLVAYLVLIFAPLRSLRRIELQTARAQDTLGRAHYYLSVGLQATMVAYMVCSFFTSIEYLWYLYYTVAYAVSLRHIHAAAETQFPEAGRGAKTVGAPRRSGLTKGVLWKTPRLPSGNEC